MKKTVDPDLIAAAWSRGILKWKLKPHQIPIYDAVWNAINNPDALKYTINCSRRFGKTFTLVLIAVEFALRNPKVQIRFAAPTAKAMRKIVFPILRIITEDCPDNLKPTFKSIDDVLVFHNESEIHFAGVDAGHSENLRGTASHLNVLDEAGSMDDLDYVMRSILLPQTLTTGGTTILASTPSVTPAHDYYQIYRECLEEGNVSEFTIYDNTSLTPELIALYMKESGGEKSTTWLREYLCKFVVDSELAVIPEWKEIYAVEPQRDEYFKYYHKYVSLDSGVRDFTVALFAYYDFRQATLFVEDEFKINGPEMTTDKLASEIAIKEQTLWPEMKPYTRVADNNNLILIQDLSYLHNLPFNATTKDNLDAMVNQTRIWVGQGRIKVSPKCKQLIGCLEFGIWKQSNAKYKEFGRSKDYGHYDALASLIYMVRSVNTSDNPIPNLHAVDEKQMWVTDEMKSSMSRTAIEMQKALNMV